MIKDQLYIPRPTGKVTNQLNALRHQVRSLRPIQSAGVLTTQYTSGVVRVGSGSFASRRRQQLTARWA